MARYQKTFPIVDDPGITFERIKAYLASQKFNYRVRDGQQLFQKGDGVWLAPSFVRIVYKNEQVMLEAWVDIYGQEQDLEGVVGVAVKKPMKKIVAEVEAILSRPGIDYTYVPQNGSVSEPMDEAQAQPRIPMNISKKEYLQKYASESFYLNLKWCAIAGYVFCGMNCLVALLNPFVLVDGAIFLALLLGMHLKKSKGCAIGILAYAIFGMALNLIVNHTISGYLWLIVGVYSMIVFRNAEKAYESRK